MTRRDLEIDLEFICQLTSCGTCTEKVTATLKAKIKAQQKVLEQRLAQIDAGLRNK